MYVENSPDISAENHGSVVLLRPLTDDGRAWLDDNLPAEPWQWFDGAIACELCCAADIVEGIEADGLMVQRNAKRRTRTTMLPIRTLHARTTPDDYIASLVAIAETWGNATATTYDASDVVVDCILSSDHAHVTKFVASRAALHLSVPSQQSKKEVER